MESIQQRKSLLIDWLAQVCPFSILEWQAITADASFRRYYRIKNNTQSFIVMDAPPPQEKCTSFIAIANALRAIELNAPEIIAADVERGFLLLSDFGDATYLTTLTQHNYQQLYQKALKDLMILSTCQKIENHNIPTFDADFMWQEWQWYKDWCLQQWLGIQDIDLGLDHCMQQLINNICQQPNVFMHRDFHSANLMVLPNQQVGILDFQDAFHGPITYDVVSLLRDCYIDWPENEVKQLVFYYWQLLTANGLLPQTRFDEFLYWFDLMSMQRHLKALLTFSRKKVRDYQAYYLKFVPRTLKYLLNVSKKYEEFHILHHFLQNKVWNAKAVQAIMLTSAVVPAKVT